MTTRERSARPAAGNARRGFEDEHRSSPGLDHHRRGADGQEALHLVTDNNNGRLRLNVGFDADQRTTLGDLDTLSFDYFIASSDRTNVISVLRLIINANANLATTSDRGEMVFEHSYQGFGASTQDARQSVDSSVPIGPCGSARSGRTATRSQHDRV